MVARQQKARATTKRGAGDAEEAEPPSKKAALQDENEDEEPGPEPTAQHVARLERKILELGAENERLKEQLETQRREALDSTEEDQPKSEAKATKAKAPPKRKPAKATAKTKKKTAKVSTKDTPRKTRSKSQSAEKAQPK
jgi:hypothetical protein